jgi:hypothetical protein
VRAKLFFCLIIFLFFIYIICFASKLIDDENFLDGIFFMICGFVVFNIMLRQLENIISNK